MKSFKAIFALMVGTILGLSITIVSAARAQDVTVTLNQAFVVLSVAGDFSVITSGVPDIEVTLTQYLPSNAREVAINLAVANGLYVCQVEEILIITQKGSCDAEAYNRFYLSPNTLVSAADGGSLPSTPVIDTDAGADSGNGSVTSSSELHGDVSTASTDLHNSNDVNNTGALLVDNSVSPVSSDGSVGNESAYPISVRLRVIEIGETDGLSFGIDWSAQTFSNLAAFALGDVSAPYRLLTADLSSALRLAESEGAGRKLDDVTLAGLTGVPLAFQAGGNIAVNLVGAGQENLTANYPYGLNVRVTVERVEESYQLQYSISSSSPVSATDPRLINVASRNIDSTVTLLCGEAAVISALRQDYLDDTGRGLPGLGSLPGIGYAFGSSDKTSSITTLLVALELACDETL